MNSFCASNSSPIAAMKTPIARRNSNVPVANYEHDQATKNEYHGFARNAFVNTFTVGNGKKALSSCRVNAGTAGASVGLLSKSGSSYANFTSPILVSGPARGAKSAPVSKQAWMAQLKQPHDSQSQSCVRKSPAKVLSEPGARQARRAWKKEEDEALMKCLRPINVENITSIPWVEVASYHNRGRSAKQCRERYHNYLRPGLKKGDWTSEEEELLNNMYETFGPRWAAMAKLFDHRTDNDIKNKWYAMKRKEKRNKQMVNNKKKLMNDISLSAGKKKSKKASIKHLPSLEQIFPADVLPASKPNQPAVCRPARSFTISNSYDEELNMSSNSNDSTVSSGPTKFIFKQPPSQLSSNLTRFEESVNVSPDVLDPISFVQV